MAGSSVVRNVGVASSSGSSVVPNVGVASSSGSSVVRNVGVASSSGLSVVPNVGVASSSGSSVVRNVGVASSSGSSVVPNVGVASFPSSSLARNVGVATSSSSVVRNVGVASSGSSVVPNVEAASSSGSSVVRNVGAASSSGSSVVPNVGVASSPGSSVALNVGVASSSSSSVVRNVGLARSSGSSVIRNVGVASSGSSVVRNVGVASSSDSSPAWNVGVTTSVLSLVPITISSSSLQSVIGNSTTTISSTLLPDDSDSCIVTSISNNNIQPPSPSAQIKLFSPFPELLSEFDIVYKDSELPLNCPGQNLENLHREFPSFSISDITVIYEVANFNYYSTRDFLSNVTLDNLLQLLHSSFIYYNTEESPKILVSQSSPLTELTEVLLGFYKSSRFNKNVCVRVAIEGNQVMNSGGARRQLFDQVFEAIAKGYYGLFEGPINQLRPVVKPSNIASGLLKNVVRAVAHRLIMDHIGFPHISPPLFYYLIGQQDIAMTLLRESDVSGQAEYVLAKVNKFSQF